MAHTVTTTKIYTGDRLAIFHVYLGSDGQSADLTDEVIIDPVVDLGLDTKARMGIEHMIFGLSTGLAVRVEFDTGLVDDKMIWVLTEHVSFVDFRPISSLRDKSGLDGTGKLQITTTGLSVANTQGSMTIQVRYP